jgi:hypothetical protein
MGNKLVLYSMNLYLLFALQYSSFPEQHDANVQHQQFAHAPLSNNPLTTAIQQAAPSLSHRTLFLLLRMPQNSDRVLPATLFSALGVKTNTRIRMERGCRI